MFGTVSVGGEGGLVVLDNFKLKTISGKPLVSGYIPVAGICIFCTNLTVSDFLEKLNMYEETWEETQAVTCYVLGLGLYQCHHMLTDLN